MSTCRLKCFAGDGNKLYGKEQSVLTCQTAMEGSEALVGLCSAALLCVLFAWGAFSFLCSFSLEKRAHPGPNL